MFKELDGCLGSFPSRVQAKNEKMWSIQEMNEFPLQNEWRL